MQNKRVFIGMSGGVDSSVSAALLKEAGFDVTGVFIKVWEPPADLLPAGCSWRDDRRDASKVAAILGIPFLTLDLEKEYKQDVVDYMIAEYKAGRTPNPDVMCNRYIKFGGFYNWAIEKGADFVATGHYAQIKKNNAEIFELHAGHDQNKDQTYFLWTLSQEVLAHTLFPIGHLEKPAVRKLAEKYHLPVATKKDSQGLCFMGKIDVKDFLKEFIEEKKGDVVTESGEVIGHHDSIMFYTLGERRGFTITKKTPTDTPYFIVGKNIETNQLVVSHNRTPNQCQGVALTLREVNWNTGVEPEENKEYQARSRYRQTLTPCRLERQNGSWQAILADTEEIPTPGQSLVIYDGVSCLGGGVID
jgi:tRNA-uridine 2-sulfurtransferase